MKCEKCKKFFKLALANKKATMQPLIHFMSAIEGTSVVLHCECGTSYRHSFNYDINNINNTIVILKEIS